MIIASFEEWRLYKYLKSNYTKFWRDYGWFDRHIELQAFYWSKEDFGDEKLYFLKVNCWKCNAFVIIVWSACVFAFIKLG
jgi:hypothetical protein